MPTRFDWCHRLANRLAYPVIRRWWRLYGHDGVVIAVWLDDRVLAVRHSYKPGLRLPRGGIGKSEDHRITAVRELQEEVGVAIDPSQLRLVFTTKSRLGSVHFYEARLESMPVLRIDRREIVEAVFLPPGSLFERISLARAEVHVLTAPSGRNVEPAESADAPPGAPLCGGRKAQLWRPGPLIRIGRKALWL
jgi:8-oxo-dGTP diphosphatase